MSLFSLLGINGEVVATCTEVEDDGDGKRNHIVGTRVLQGRRNRFFCFSGSNEIIFVFLFNSKLATFNN